MRYTQQMQTGRCGKGLAGNKELTLEISLFTLGFYKHVQVLLNTGVEITTRVPFLLHEVGVCPDVEDVMTVSYTHLTLPTTAIV